MHILVIWMVERNHDYGVNTITFFIEKHGLERRTKRRWEYERYRGRCWKFILMGLIRGKRPEQAFFFSEFIWNVNIPSKALSTYCNSLLNYSSGGKKRYKKPLLNKKTCANGKSLQNKYNIAIESIFEIICSKFSSEM